MEKNENVRLYKKQLKQIQSVIDDICNARIILRAEGGNERAIADLDKQEEGIDRLLSAFGYRISLGWIVKM